MLFKLVWSIYTYTFSESQDSHTASDHQCTMEKSSIFYLGPKNAHLETLLAAICQTERQSYSLIPWELPTLFLRPPSSSVLTFQLMAGREMKTYPFQSPFNKATFYQSEILHKEGKYYVHEYKMYFPESMQLSLSKVGLGNTHKWCLTFLGLFWLPLPKIRHHLWMFWIRMSNLLGSF